MLWTPVGDRVTVLEMEERGKPIVVDRVSLLNFKFLITNSLMILF